MNFTKYDSRTFATVSLTALALCLGACSGGASDPGSEPVPDLGQPAPVPTTRPVVDSSGNPVLDGQGMPVVEVIPPEERLPSTAPAPQPAAPGTPLSPQIPGQVGGTDPQTPSGPPTAANPTLPGQRGTVPGEPGQSPGATPPSGACQVVVPAPRRVRLLTPDEVSRTLKDIFDLDDLPNVSAIPPYVINDATHFPDAVRSSLLQDHIEKYLSVGEAIAGETVERLGNSWRYNRIRDCNQGLETGACQRAFVQHFGERMFRRPITDQEIAPYLSLFDDELTGGDAEAGFALVVSALTVSPNFLYRSEVGDSTGELDDYEIATLMAFHFTGKGPSEDLMEDAAAGKLKDPAYRRELAEDWVGDEQFRERMVEFGRRWTGGGGVVRQNKDEQLFPAFDGIKQAMLEEHDTFFEALLFDDNATAASLFTPDFITVNDQLARYYGLQGNGNQQTSRQTNPAGSGRGGILRMGAFIASHSDMQEINPVKLGFFVRQALMCQQVPPPPAGLVIEPVAFDPAKPLRERYAEHASASAGCSGCHAWLDEVGFTFSGYSAAGSKVDGQNEAGKVVGVETLSDEAATVVANLDELSTLLANSPNAQSCIAKQYWRYTFAQDDNGGQEACEVEVFRNQFAAGGTKLKDLLVNIVESPSFVKRRLTE